MYLGCAIHELHSCIAWRGDRDLHMIAEYLETQCQGIAHSAFFQLHIICVTMGTQHSWFPHSLSRTALPSSRMGQV
ncbi:hypothetical protein LINPERPRIM_LOCUS23742 [Linum perenne]